MAATDKLHDLHAMSGAYALDALDDLERLRFEQHLAICAECRDEVAGFVDTAALLGAAAAVVPSSALRNRVLAEISQVRPMAPDSVPEPRRPDELEAMRASSSRHRGAGRRWAPMVLVAAAVALVVGIGVGAIVNPPWHHDQSSTVAADQAQIARVLDAKDATSSRADLGGGTATVWRSKSVGRAVVVLAGVKAPSDKVYQLWLVRASGATSAGLVPDRADQTVLLQGDAATASAAAISVEPTGGSSTPSGIAAQFPFDRSA